VGKSLKKKLKEAAEREDFAKMRFSITEYYWLQDVVAEAIKKRKASGTSIDNLRRKFDLEKVM
jgi:hypothetical protein